MMKTDVLLFVNSCCLLAVMLLLLHPSVTTNAFTPTTPTAISTRIRQGLDSTQRNTREVYHSSSLLTTLRMSSSSDPDEFYFAKQVDSSTTTTTVEPPLSPPPPSPSSSEATTTEISSSTTTDPKTVVNKSTTTTITNGEEQQEPQQEEFRRILGSQELLMLPRQYKPGKVNFPQMNHVIVVTLNQTPTIPALKRAIENALKYHPLLRSYVQGDGEPTRRIDLFQMVRYGEPNPPTFVTSNDKFKADDILTIVETEDDLKHSWQKAFVRDLDDGSWWCHAETGPLWKVELHTSNNRTDAKDAADSSSCALLFSFHHAISDQSSANRLIDQVLERISEIEEEEGTTAATANVQLSQPMPMALEDSVMGLEQRWKDVGIQGFSLRTIQYVFGKAAEGLKNPVILPDETDDKSDSSSGNFLTSALSIMSGRTAGGEDVQPRHSTVQFRSVSAETTKGLLEAARSHKVSMSNVLTAAVTLTATDFVGGEKNNENKRQSRKRRNYKILQSLDMRRFGQQLDDGATVACMASSHDLMHGPLQDGSGEAVRRNPSAQRLEDTVWKLAREAHQQTLDFIDSGGPYQAVRVFDFAMSISDLNNLVHLSGQSQATKGRGFSAGVTNNGVYERQLGFERRSNNDASSSSERPKLQLQHGRYQIQDIFYATPHVTSGSLFQVSGLTVSGELKLTFNPVEPIVSAETNAQFADAFVDLLEKIAGEPVPHQEEEKEFRLPEHALTKATAIVGLVAVLTHAGAWASFFSSVMEMKNNVADPADFWAALNFWIFFAVGHPILQPILRLSDVLHGSPGPLVAGLVPVTFLAGNIIVIAAVIFSKEVRNAVNIAALAAFFTYVGAGLDGTAGLGDFNLALDDSYKGQVVKGCPAYDEVRQSSMDGFDLNRYQGLWYEQKFHDWTQFKEVYDTTLDIRLTEGGLGWVDDFAVKGPAPDAAPLSWDKSPVGNGAHYYLFGRVDPKDPQGILREKGFGVEFPNYIVDVKKDPATGEYTESIQFQCLERGGVRVFEGINFMSRNFEMTDAEMQDMHARAEKAGMYPYGAAPEQMHTVARRPLDAPELENNWQSMWHAIGVDRLLELLTEAIEDDKR